MYFAFTCVQWTDGSAWCAILPAVILPSPSPKHTTHSACSPTTWPRPRRWPGRRSPPPPPRGCSRPCAPCSRCGEGRTSGGHCSIVLPTNPGPNTTEQAHGLQGALSLAATRAKRAPKRRELDFGSPQDEADDAQVRTLVRCDTGGFRIGLDLNLVVWGVVLGIHNIVDRLIPANLHPRTNPRSGGSGPRRARSGRAPRPRGRSRRLGRRGPGPSACWTGRIPTRARIRRRKGRKRGGWVAVVVIGC